MRLEAAKWKIRRGLKRGGWVIRKEPQLIDFLRSRKVDLVLDVGANVGQFGQELRAWGYAGRIVSFEPVADAFALLGQVSAGDSAWQIRNHALGARDENAEIQVTRSTVFSSIVPQTPATRVFGADSEVVTTQTIAVKRLDGLIDEFAGRRVFLKVDTQGYELPVLEGAQAALGRMLGVQLELPVEFLYENDWTFAEALGYLERAGFRLAQARPVNYLKTDPVAAMEFDCIFRNLTSG